MPTWEQMFSTNFFGPVRLTRALLPAMRAAGRGRIVMVSSMGAIRGMPGIGAYSATKGALERWAESLSFEIAPFGLGVTVLVAGSFKTDILELTQTYADTDGPYAALHLGLETIRPPVPPLRPTARAVRARGRAAPSEEQRPFTPARRRASTAASSWSAAASCPPRLLQRITDRAVGHPPTRLPPRRPAPTGQRHRTTQRRREPLADSPAVEFEPRMLIDGKLVDGEAGTFTNINPATEEPSARSPTRRPPTCTGPSTPRGAPSTRPDWSTDRAFRKQCLLQLQAALEAEQETLREELILEVGCPRMVTHGPQLDLPLADGLTYPAELIDEYPWETELGDAMVELTGTMTTRKVWREPVGVVGAIVPWNYPFEVTIHKLGQALATGNTVVLKPAPDTPFNATRIGRLVAERTDIPPGVLNVVTAVGPPRRRGAHPLTEGRPDLLHRLDTGRHSASWRRAPRR